MIKHKSWGFVDSFAHTPFYQGRVVFIRKDEIYGPIHTDLNHVDVYISEGCAFVNKNGKEFYLPWYHHTSFIPGDEYQITACGTDVLLFEVSTGKSNE